jgi:hypothetical protein
MELKMAYEQPGFYPVQLYLAAFRLLVRPVKKFVLVLPLVFHWRLFDDVEFNSHYLPMANQLF